MSTHQFSRSLNDSKRHWITPFTPILSSPSWAAGQRVYPAPVRPRLERRHRPTPHFERETGRLFAEREVAQRQTEFWESVVFGALAMSGLMAMAISLFAI